VFVGAYAAWLSGALGDGESGAAHPARSVLERTLLVADFEPPAASLTRLLGGVPRVMVLPAPPVAPCPGVQYHCFRTATNPLLWDDGVDDALRDGIDTVAFLLPPAEVRGQTLMRLRRLGVRRILWPGRRLPALPPLPLALCRKLASMGDKALRKVGIGSGAMTEAQCRAVLAHARGRPNACPGSDGPLRIAHFVTSLNSGGAERQACNAAVLQRQRGHDVRVLVRLALVGDDAHYSFLLRPHGVTARRIGSGWSDAFPAAWRQQGLSAAPFRLMPTELATMVADLVGELLTDPVDVLHCYVDDCNVVGVIAAALAGTPGVVLSFRNGNPTNFPGLWRPWMLAWYRATLGRPGVRLSSNSERGARDYERWLGLPEGAVPVVRNAFEPPPVPGPDDALRWRRKLGIAAGAPVVAGVFRLQPEKRPLYFLECIARLRRAVPGLRAVLAGVGELEPEVRRKVAAAGLLGVITLLGQRRDVPRILAGSDIFLLTSDWEGTPNIVLEAQHCGCVPVATDAGGSGEAMDPGRTGLLVGLHDVDGTVRAVAALLADEGRRRRMAEAGPAFVAGRFSPQGLYEGNDRLYREALAAGTIPYRTISTELCEQEGVRRCG
jgi:glycosyltransferase involved in cell wall biosynthesis